MDDKERMEILEAALAQMLKPIREFRSRSSCELWPSNRL